MTPPTSTDAFITWADRIIDAPNPSVELQLQYQRFNKETWRSLRQRLFIYTSTHRKDFFTRELHLSHINP